MVAYLLISVLFGDLCPVERLILEVFKQRSYLFSDVSLRDEDKTLDIFICSKCGKAWFFSFARHIVKYLVFKIQCFSQPHLKMLIRMFLFFFSFLFSNLHGSIHVTAVKHKEEIIQVTPGCLPGHEFNFFL